MVTQFLDALFDYFLLLAEILGLGLTLFELDADETLIGSGFLGCETSGIREWAYLFGENL